MNTRLLSHAAIACVAAAVAAGPALAAPDGGTVEGTLVVSEKVGAPKVRYPGFVERMPNPIIKTKPYDPTPEMIVVLVGGEVADDDKTPPKDPARVQIIGESFERLVVGVQVGRELEIKNIGRGAPLLHTPGADLLAPEALNPGGVRRLKLAAALQPVQVAAKDSAHLRATVVGFDHPYFSALDAKGQFRIEGVPAGRWKLRIWYRDGWLEMDEQVVDVTARRTANVKNVSIPPALQVKKSGN